MATLHPAQLDPFALNGAGAVAGATSITLKSFQTIDGVNLAMADFGTVGYITIDPGNGTLEEQASFTGVVQNSNGTATLSGISTVLFLSPYTETSGLAKTHAGSAPVVVSNTSGFHNQFAIKNNDEIIPGQWTFLNTPIVPGTVSDASTTVKGIAKTSVAPLLASNPIMVGDNDTRVPQNAYAVDSGTANVYAITLTPAPAAYAAGQMFFFKAAHTNTAASTLNVNGLGVKTIKLSTGADTGANVIITGQIVQVEYDGTNFQMVSPLGYTTDYQAFTGSGTWTKPVNCTGNEVVIVQAWGAGAGGSSAGASIGGGGGGGGAFVEAKFLASALSSTVTVTIPAGGAINTAGGNATFGSYLTAYGGGHGGTGTTGGVGGGGGGGALSVGSNNSTTTGGAGGSPGGAAASASNSGFGGGGGSSVGQITAGSSAYGGGGGGGSSSNGAQSGGPGGSSLFGGGGGGAGTSSGGDAAGGTSVYGGAGGLGGQTPAVGTAPGGGGGGGGTGAIGGRGEIRVWTITS